MPPSPPRALPPAPTPARLLTAVASTAPQTRRAHTPPVQVVTAEVGTATTSTIAATTASPAVSTTVATVATAAAPPPLPPPPPPPPRSPPLPPPPSLWRRWGRVGGREGSVGGAWWQGWSREGSTRLHLARDFFLAGSFYVFECIFAIALVMS